MLEQMSDTLRGGVCGVVFFFLFLKMHQKVWLN